MNSSYSRRAIAVTLLAAISSSVLAQSANSEAKLKALVDGKPHLRKMTSELLQLRKDVGTGAQLAAAAKQRSAGHAIHNDKIQVILGVESITEDLLKAVRGARVDIVSTQTVQGINHVIVQTDDPRKLDTIAERADVRGITSEPEARTNAGVALNQASKAMRADEARTTFTITGAGIRVGVLSDSFVDQRMGSGSIVGGFLNGSTDQVSGDLPPNIRMIDAGPALLNSDEGNAMAQLIYDVAPSCDIAFASAFTSYLDFASNITELRTDVSAPSDVIVDDVIYYVEPMYQDGPIAVAANASGLNGVPYFSSAGNNAANGHERPYADFNAGSDSFVEPPTGVDAHDFGISKALGSDRHLTFNVSGGAGNMIAVLKWDEPYGGTVGSGPGSQADLDMYLVNSTVFPLVAGGGGNIISQSSSNQGAVGSPFGEAYEYISVNSLAVGTYHIVVDHYGGREPVNLSVILYPGANTTISDSGLIGDRTIFGHAAAANVLAVGAMHYFEWEPGASSTGTFGYLPGQYEPLTNQFDVEPFSSLGGNLPFYFPASGTPRNASAETRFKPEITAPDGCDTTFFGSDFEGSGRPNFFGTSAAAPNAASVAALVLHKAAKSSVTLSASTLYNILRTNARQTKSNGVSTLNVETLGPDSLSGDGVVDALNASGDSAAPVSISGWTLE